MGYFFFRFGVIVQRKDLVQYVLPTDCSEGCPFPIVVPVFPGGKLGGFGHHEQDTVKQPVFLEAFFQKLVYTLGLRGPDDVYTWMLDVYRNRGVYPGNIQSPATPCGQKLFYELPVRVTVGGIEHAHDLVHQNGNAPWIVVMCL